MTRSAKRRMERSTTSCSGAPKFIRQAISFTPSSAYRAIRSMQFRRFADDEVVRVHLGRRSRSLPVLGHSQLVRQRQQQQQHVRAEADPGSAAGLRRERHQGGTDTWPLRNDAHAPTARHSRGLLQVPLDAALRQSVCPTGSGIDRYANVLPFLAETPRSSLSALGCTRFDSKEYEIGTDWRKSQRSQA
jgi:hypothetical protein